MSTEYVHGTASEEQERLARLNDATNAPYLSFLELKPDWDILEVGSGLGMLTNAVAELAHEGRVTGLEYSHEQLAKAVVKKPNLSFIQGDAHQLPFEDNRFDLVYCRCVLEHLADPVKAVREMRRVLKPGGHVAILENNTPLVDQYPDCPTGAHLLRKFCELQSMLGGDAYIGKKLFFYLKTTGFENIVLSMQPEIHRADQPTFVWWMENMISIIEGASAQMESRKLVTRQELDKGLGELRALFVNPDASSYFYWNRARAIKPK